MKLPAPPAEATEQATQAAPAPTAPAPTAPAAQPTVEQQIDGTAPVQANAQTSTEKKLSPKHKASRGVPEGWVTTWVPLDLPAAESERIHQVATVRERKVPDMLQEVLKYGLEQYKPQFDADAAKYVPSTSTGKTAKKIADMTPEEAERYAMSSVERQQKALLNAQAMLTAAREKAQAAAEAARANALAAASQAQGAPVTTF